MNYFKWLTSRAPRAQMNIEHEHIIAVATYLRSLYLDSKGS